jgi:hypothetical protein
MVKTMNYQAKYVKKANLSCEHLLNNCLPYQSEILSMNFMKMMKYRSIKLRILRKSNNYPNPNNLFIK